MLIPLVLAALPVLSSSLAVPVPLGEEAFGNEAVGIYGAQYRIIFTIQMFVGWYVFSAFPILSSLLDKSRSEFHALLSGSIKFMGFIIYWLSLAIIILAPQIIKVLYGQGYSAGKLALQVLALSMSFGFVGTLLNYMLTAANEQKKGMRSIVITSTLNVVLNFALIPPLGLLGAALATGVASITRTALILRYFRIVFNRSHWTLMLKMFGLFLACLALFWSLKALAIPEALAILAGLASFPLLLNATRIITWKQVSGTARQLLHRQ